MLFTYPVAATANNWLHECLCEMIQSIHENLDAGNEPPEWPDIIPDDHRETLCSRRGLRDRINAYRQAAEVLNAAERKNVIQILTDQNEIERLLRLDHNCGTTNDLPENLRERAKNLFVFAFKLLTALEIRDVFYGQIYEASPDHTCPFCGCEYFDSPGAAREDLDHYLPKDSYPFVAANLRNLVPMGHKCNSGYKGGKDILKRQDGTRRRAIDPYGGQSIQVSLDNSEPFNGDDGITPEWQIEFVPNSEEATTWDEVFQIRTRYKRDVLDQSFTSWLTDFSRWCKTAEIAVETDASLINAISRYKEYWGGMGFKDRAFLRKAAFQMFESQCENGNQRLITLFRDVVVGV